MGSQTGVRKAAAARFGLTYIEYMKKVDAGQKWCGRCKSWKSTADFTADRSRGDGLSNWCRGCKQARHHAIYRPKLRPSPGRRYVAARDGDALQARRRVNHLVDIGQISHPNALSCVDCGHEHGDGERRHAYDHHLGYAAQHHEDVEAVCTTCHHAREALRRVA